MKQFILFLDSIGYFTRFFNVVRLFLDGLRLGLVNGPLRPVINLLIDELELLILLGFQILVMFIAALAQISGSPIFTFGVFMGFALQDILSQF